MMFTQLDAPCLKQDVLGKQKRYIARICVSFARTVGRSLDSGRAFAGKENLAKLEKFVRSLIGRGEARTYSSRRQVLMHLLGSHSCRFAKPGIVCMLQSVDNLLYTWACANFFD